MGYYHDVYLKRLNRYGIDFQSRLQRQREENFELQLKKSVYLVTFDYDGEEQVGELTRKSQDNSETTQYLLTRIGLKMPNGTILQIGENNWMIYWLEQIQASGYNRYIVLKMTHTIRWTARDGNQYESLAYMYGQEDNMLKDEIRSRSRMNTIYSENLKSTFFVMPTHPKLRKDDYFEVGEGELLEPYRVTGYDIQSTPGVEFVTVDPIYKYDLTPAPEKPEGDTSEDYYWLSGGSD